MTLARGSIEGYEFDRMVLKFSMLDGAREVPCAVSASAMDDLERVLLEISHSPSEVSNDQLDALRQEIESRGLLFKVRVLGSQVRQEESKPVSEKEKRKL